MAPITPGSGVTPAIPASNVARVIPRAVASTRSAAMKASKDSAGWLDAYPLTSRSAKIGKHRHSIVSVRGFQRISLRLCGQLHQRYQTAAMALEASSNFEFKKHDTDSPRRRFGEADQIVHGNRSGAQERHDL